MEDEKKWVRMVEVGIRVAVKLIVIAIRQLEMTFAMVIASNVKSTLHQINNYVDMGLEKYDWLS